MSYSSKRARIEQHAEPLARGQPALGVLRGDPLLAAAQPRRPRGAFRVLRSWLPFGGSSPSKSGRRSPSTSGSAGQSGGSTNAAVQQRSNLVKSDHCCGTVIPVARSFLRATHATEVKRKMLTRVGVPVELEAELSAPGSAARNFALLFAPAVELRLPAAAASDEPLRARHGRHFLGRAGRDRSAGDRLPAGPRGRGRSRRPSRRPASARRA